MTETLRPSTLAPLGLGTVLDFFRTGRPTVSAANLVEEVFGPPGERGCMVISGANGIVGAGKLMQFGARLEPWGVPLVALDFPGGGAAQASQARELTAALGVERANRVLSNIIRLIYDGHRLPPLLASLKPRFLLETIPEDLALKRAHYRLFREAFPGIAIRSVTSGFPGAELGVGIAHPSFPHAVNSVFECVEAADAPIARLLWALGLVPIPVADRWSFVLDVLFCGLTLAGTASHEASNLPYWKLDKLIRRRLGPNPFRAHDAIGSRGATFLTWSCLDHLARVYGPLFQPTAALGRRKDEGSNWYPPDHFRPLVDWPLDAAAEEALETRLLGPLFQMTSLLLHEQRASLAGLNRIGELCAQFRRGILALIRAQGREGVIARVEAWQRLAPAMARSPWHPEVFDRLDSPEWAQLYVNAEHDGRLGVITLGSEQYHWEVDVELNRALDWLLAAGIERVILSGDFHLSAQWVGADIAEFFPALDDQAQGEALCRAWAGTARRLNQDFRVAVGFIGGKRCLGGMLELMLHCHHLVAVADAELGMPEVGLPVIPGMDGCHWPFRTRGREHWPALGRLLLTGQPVRASEVVGPLVDYAAPLEEALAMAARLALEGVPGLAPRVPVAEPLPAGELAAALGGALGQAMERGPGQEDAGEGDRGGAVGAFASGGAARAGADAGARSAEAGGSGGEVHGKGEGEDAVRRALAEAIRAACGVSLAESLEVQSRHSAAYLAGAACRWGRIGAERQRVMAV